MENKTLIGTIITAFVAITMIAALMVPVVSEMSKTHETFNNTLYSEYQMKELENGDSWTHTDGKWYYGDSEITLSTSGSAAILQNDVLFVQQYGIYRGVYQSGNTTVSYSVGDGTYSINGSPEVAFTKGFGAVPEGDYILKSNTNPAYILGDSEVFSALSVTLVSGNSSSMVYVVIGGSVEDGFTATATKLSNSSVTDIVVDECVANVESVSGYDNLYKISSFDIQISGTVSEQTETVELTYGEMVIPKIISAELPNHAGASEVALYGIIPTIFILSILVGIVFITFRRNE